MELFMNGRIKLLLLLFFCLSKPYGLYATSICIFDDHLDAHTSKNNAILYEFKKTLHAQAEHIFITPYVWNSFITSLSKHEQQPFIKNWDIFDTHIGLFYLKHKHAANQVGIRLSTFDQLSQPFRKQKRKYVRWTSTFNTLFDLAQWKTYHQKNPEHKFIYMNGHGSPRGCHYSCEFACGISATKFASILKFFNDDLKIDLVGIQSCYWTSKRIFEVMKKKYGYKHLTYSIITPLRSEKPLWVTDLPKQCSCSKSSYYCFYEGIKRIVQNYHGKITSKMKAIAQHIDTIKVRKNKNQGINMILAGSDKTEDI